MLLPVVACDRLIQRVKLIAHIHIFYTVCTHCTGLKFDLSYSTDIAEASLLGYNTDYIQVYSNSWGPVDNGFHVNGPGTWLTRALQTGVSEVKINIMKKP